MSTASVRDVAKRAEVSVGTVSNVLNHPEIVSTATRERVQAAIRELGFVRNESARHLRAGRSRSVGMIVLDVANPYFTDVARGVEELADDHDTMVVLCNSGASPERERRYLEQLEEQRVLGILITPVETSSPHIDQLVARGTPVVLVDRAAGRDRCSVAVDDVLGGRLAGNHLVQGGNRHIAFVGGPPSIKQVSDRLQGLDAAVSDAEGRPVGVTHVATSSLTVADGRDAGQRIADLPVGKRPEGAFCANDLVALGLLQEMTRRGIRVPEDLSIVGYDDIGFSAAAAVPLSSVRQPREQLGNVAMELLLDEVERTSGHSHRQVVFQPELVVRESSRRA